MKVYILYSKVLTVSKVSLACVYPATYVTMDLNDGLPWDSLTSSDTREGCWEKLQEIHPGGTIQYLNINATKHNSNHKVTL